ncbi:MAG TPA: hypothetical protein VHP33_18520 [Polyangiaceae bacterium]|nr:hypothetical protein [Polyangiaceae bacterium]
MTSTIQSVGSNASVYDPPQHLSLAPPAAASGSQSTAPTPPPAVMLLVKQNPPAAGAACTEEAAKLAAASVNLLRSLGQVAVGAPTLIAEIPAILGFVAAAMLTGAAAADYVNCKEEAGPEQAK